MRPDEVESRVRAYYAAVRSGDIDAVAALFATDAVMRDPVGAPPATDDAQRRQRYAGIAAAFDAFSIDADEVIAGGDEAAARWTISGTSKGGRAVRFGGISTFAFDGEGRITIMSAYLDMASAAKAMTA